ncbi:MAG: GNAT family N-acetyltransferase [Leptospiraceae bacterium]|nr:GNAT family N-acetyltransferase [Leptospiraceae bacterium]
MIRIIEEMSLNAWPAHRQMLYDGWLLRFSSGFTRRANSVQPLYPGDLSTAHRIQTCEQIYAALGLPPLFRITPIVEPSDLDSVLESVGYKQVHATIVLAGPLPPQEFDHALPAGARFHVSDTAHPEDSWLHACATLQGLNVEQSQHLERILSGIVTRRLLVRLEIGGRTIACAMGVIQEAAVGIFQLVTDPDYRRQGVARAVVAHLLERSRQFSCRQAYLQVELSNRAALALFHKMDFSEIYQYHYRVASPHRNVLQSQ